MSDRLETDRLILRRWRETDRSPFAALCADAHVMRHFPQTLTRAESDAIIDRTESQFAAHGLGRFAVELTACGSFAGFVGLAIPPAPLPFMPCVEISWRLATEFHGRGLATEAANAVLHHGFTDLGLDEIVSFTVVENRPSRRVMEKIGMTHDTSGDFEHPSLPDGDPLRPHVLYRITRRAFDERR